MVTYTCTIFDGIGFSAKAYFSANTAYLLIVLGSPRLIFHMVAKIPHRSYSLVPQKNLGRFTHRVFMGARHIIFARNSLNGPVKLQCP